MARITVQITTPSNNRITVSPGISALSSVQLYLNELVDVDTSGGQDGYVLTQQADGSFAMEAIVTTLSGLSDTNISSPNNGNSLVYDGLSQKWIPQTITFTPPPTPGISGLADTNITNLQDDQIIRYDSNSGKWLNEDLEALPAGGTTGQALVKATNTDYDVQWADISIDVQYHNRYQTTAESLRAGATATTELYYTAQADGDGFAESASSDTPTAGYDIKRKLYYSEAAQADPDTGTWIQFAAIADNTTFANAKAALLAYLKERTGGTVPISLKMTWEEVAQAPSFTGLLNESYGSGAAAAYSTRRLNGNVSECMVIRRASDSTTQTIGFDSNGNIDEVAINTFCSGTTCTVYQWLDQSGNGNTATAPSTTAEPTIYTGGAIVKENGKVALQFDGSDDYFDAGTGFSLTNFSAVTLQTAQNTLSGTNSYPFSLMSDNNNGWRQHLRLDANGIRTRVNTVNIDLTTNPTTKALISSLFNGSSGFQYVDGGNEVTASTSLSATSSMPLQIGAATNVQTYKYEGKFQEALLFNSSKSTSDRTSIESNIGDYFTQNTPLLDTYSGAAACYSLRLMRTAYTGSAIRVRRSSDNTEQDINFNVFGELDTVSLLAFAGTGDAFVKTWYDQSGNSNDATQTNTANQPQIVSSGAVIVENGKPAVYSSGGHNLNTGLFAIGTSGDITLDFFGVMTNQSVSDGALFQLGDDVKTQDRRHVLCYGNDSATQKTVRLYGGFVLVDSTATGQVLFNTNYQGGGGAFDVRFDGASATLDSFNNTGLNVQANSGFALFGQSYSSTPSITSTSTNAIGYLQEVVFYLSNQSSNRANIEDNINTFYSIY